MLTLKNVNLKGKTVLLRVDLNSPIIKNKISLNPRIKAHAETIKTLKKKKAKIIILAHQGRKGDEDYMESLQQHAKLLSKFTKVNYINDLKIKKPLKNSEAVLLKNVRSNEKQVLKLKADYFILDAFSIAHRNQPSITGFKIKTICGPVMKKEIDHLDKIHKPKKPFVLILAGAKPEESILLLKKTKANIILTAGLFGQLCLLAKGKKLGAQEKYFKEKGLKVTSELKKLVKAKKVITPEDFAVKKANKRLELARDKFPVKYEIFDIGSKTIKKYTNIIKKAKTIFEKGPVGYYQDKKFSKGTKAIFKALEKSKSFTLLAGGDTTTALEKLKINKNKISYISLSGGALVQYLAGKKLPGVKLVKR